MALSNGKLVYADAVYSVQGGSIMIFKMMSVNSFDRVPRHTFLLLEPHHSKCRVNLFL